MGSVSLVRRFGWLCDHVEAEMPEEVRKGLLKMAANGRRTSVGPDPARALTVPDAIGYSETWRLFVNVSGQELHGSAGLAAASRSGREKSNDHPAAASTLCRRLRYSRHHDRGKRGRADLLASTPL